MLSRPGLGRVTIAPLVAAVTLGVSAPAALGGPAKLVDPLIGTDAGQPNFGTGGGAGNTFPGATMPFGMVQMSPDTRPNRVAFGGGYSYPDRRIEGFSLKHMSGPGCRAYGDVSLLPLARPLSGSPVVPKSGRLRLRHLPRFRHRRERAGPGFYRVVLDPGRRRAVAARVTATERVGLARFAFRARGRARVLLDAASTANGARAASLTVDPGAGEVTGTVEAGGFCSQPNTYRLHFAARFSRAPKRVAVWERGRLRRALAATSSAAGERPAAAGAVLDFGAARQIEARIGISFVSVEGARRNRDAETGGRTFGAIRRSARATWNGLLGRVSVAGGPRPLRRLFYTSLYHALLHPSISSDVDGRYRGFDRGVHTATRIQYADFSGWDTYRTQMPLVAMLAPERASDMVTSMLAAVEQSGALPKWSVANDHTNTMVGDPAAPLIAGAHAFGARGFDVDAALAALVAGATQPGPASGPTPYVQRPGLAEYLSHGYVPHDVNVQPPANAGRPDAVWGSAATTLEYALADFAIGELAAARCATDEHEAFAARAGGWRKVFDPGARRVLPRFANGSFRRQPAGSPHGFVEGNSAQYTLFVPHDAAGLVEALGGRAAAVRRLNRFFKRLNAGPRRPFAFLGNEPSLGAPWLYHWAGRPDRVQGLVRRALLRLYADSPGGLPGNDDLGTLGAWWVFGALGLYPAIPGTDVLALGSPLFRRAVLRLPAGQVRIRAPGAAPGRPYVRGLRLDGEPHPRAWLRFGELTGSTLRFALAKRPARGFAADPSAVPPSYPGPRALAC